MYFTVKKLRYPYLLVKWLDIGRNISLEGGTGYISVAVIKIPDKRLCKENRAFLAYGFRGHKSLHDVESLAQAGKVWQQEQKAGWSRFYLYTENKEREQEIKVSFKAQVQIPPYPNPVTKQSSTS